MNERDEADETPGQEPRSAATPDVALDARALRVVFLELLGRPPFVAEAERWLGRGLGQLGEALCGTLEYWRAWLDEQLYYFMLIDNFRPHDERLAEAPAALAERKLDTRAAIHRICLSASFELRNPGADTFVTVVMEQLLGLEVQKSARELELGKVAYDGRTATFLGVSAGSQADVVRIAIEDAGFARHFLWREYERIVHEEPPARELAGWARAYRSEPAIFPQLVLEWLRGEAFARRLARRHPQANRMFVRSLFVDVLDRLPTDQEAEALREALDGLSDPAPLRAVVCRSLLEGPRFTPPKESELGDGREWIRGRFLRLLAREPAEEELAAFAAALGDESCHPTTILYALLSSPEYATY